MLSINEIVIASNGKLINGNKENIIKTFKIDSRESEKDDFYIPIIGEKNDGHKFILDCVKNKIKGFYITSTCIDKENIIKESIKINKDINIIEVEDTLKSLEAIGEYNRKKHIDIPIIAVTGSVGKTSTRQMIASVLSKKYNVLVTYKNYNSNIGLPLMLLKIERQDICVLEVGISNFGEMDIITKYLKPNVAVITNIGTSHIEFFKTQDNILKEKFKITSNMQKEKIVILNSDDKYLENVSEKKDLKTIKYSKNDCSNIQYFNNKVEYDTTIYGETTKVIINALGTHNIYNSLVAIKVGEIYNIKKEDIVRGISEYSNFLRRFEIKSSVKGVTIIDDAYNSSYDSVKSGLDTFSKLNYKRKVVVLGDMLELGEYSATMHEKVGMLFKEYNFDKVILIGSQSVNTYKEAVKYLKDKAKYFKTKEEAIEDIIKEEKGTAIYFKASNSMKFSEIIENIIK